MPVPVPGVRFLCICWCIPLSWKTTLPSAIYIQSDPKRINHIRLLFSEISAESFFKLNLNILVKIFVAFSLRKDK